MNNIATPQFQAPLNSAGIMGLINQLSTGSTLPAVSTSAAATTATTSRSNLGLLTQVAETQNVMARVMEMAFNTVDRVINFATALFSGNLLNSSQSSGTLLPPGTGVIQNPVSQLPIGSTEPALPDWMQTAIQAGKEIWGLFTGDSSVILDGIERFAPAIWSGAKNLAGNAWDAVKETGSSIWDGIKGFGSKAWDAASSWVSGLF